MNEQAMQPAERTPSVHAHVDVWSSPVSATVNPTSNEVEILCGPLYIRMTSADAEALSAQLAEAAKSARIHEEEEAAQTRVSA